MIPRDKLVGQRIVKIVGDSSPLDESLGIDIGDYSCKDFIYVAENEQSFSMPMGDPDEGDFLSVAKLTSLHEELNWDFATVVDLNSKLWSATIVDIRIAENVEERYPDSGFIELSSGWFLVQLCAGSPGISPNVNLVQSIKDYNKNVSVWN